MDLRIGTDWPNAYARFGRGDAGARHVFRGTAREKVYSDFRGLLLDEDMQSLIHRKIVVEQTRLDKESFRNMLRNIRREVRERVAQMQPTERGSVAPQFSLEVFGPTALKLAGNFANRVGQLEGCQRHGIEGLLRIPVIRMAIGASLSFSYASIYERKPERGDSRDILHATLAAAAADVFVTHDEDLREFLLPRVGVPGFRAVTLPELLDSI
jgi:hypothetical protein